MLALLPLIKSPWALLAIACVIGAGGTGWYRMQYIACEGAREADRTAAEKAKNAALAKAQATSDAIIIEQAQALAATAARVQTVTERIVRVPITTACAASPAVSAAIGGLQSILRPAGGGEPQAERGAPAALPAPAKR